MTLGGIKEQRLFFFASDRRGPLLHSNVHWAWFAIEDHIGAAREIKQFKCLKSQLSSTTGRQETEEETPAQCSPHFDSLGQFKWFPHKVPDG